MKIVLKLAMVLVVLLFSVPLVSTFIEASSPPPMPTIYSGSITVGGVAPVDSEVRTIGVRNECVSNCVTVKMGDFVSDGGIVRGGAYSVTVGPPNSSYVSNEVLFYYDDVVVADQTDRFMISASFRLVSGFNLTFAHLPTPTPVPSATPTATAVPTPSPVPTATPQATPKRWPMPS